MMKKKAHFIVSGRVQGVCYRMYACEEAQRLKLTGWVRNKFDGTVEIMAEGDEEAISGFLGWCRQGPSHARVTGVDEEYFDYNGEFGCFEIK